MADKLPTPATAADMYAHAAVTELRRLNDNIERLINGSSEPVDAANDDVELKEPVEDKKPAHRDTKKVTAKKS